ncbi:hypothetical protein BKA63DRAFT_564808 [Paraphoma chrysanthemicola]|nr:hypothetical protein BKA63DRAFT_564808 [Paraphoma chrysanthemicola]
MPSRYPFRKTSARKEYHSPAGIQKRANAKDNSVKSPLLSLPPELRTKIWAYALAGTRTHVHKRYSVQRTKSARGHGLVRSRIISPLSLLRVSRQVYSEAALLPYHLTTFFFDDYNDLRAFQLALKQAQLDALEVIAISTPLAREMYVPPPRPRPYGMRASVPGRGMSGVLWLQSPRSEYYKSTPFKLGQMFPSLRMIVLDKAAEMGDLEDVMEKVRQAEGGKMVVFE